MTLDRDQVIDLLTVIAAYDRRSIGEGDIAAWAESARRAGWRFDDAVNAVHDHFADSSRWLMPGHVTERIRLARRQPAPAADVLALDKPRASESGRRQAQAMFAELARRSKMPDA
ncbi:hypothetical protein WKY82_10450 [Gordonia malaquae]|uniref:hypothetical protein n=1 Tax=Gordonia malaquae TaxID=410332 RepID=UPI0030C795AD